MEKSKGKKVVLILIILLLVVLVVAGGAYAYIATDLFKSEEQLFKKYFVSGFLEASKFNSEPYGEAFKRMETEPTELTATIKVKEEESYYNDYEELETKVTLKTDIPNRNESLSMSIKKDKEDYAKADFLITDNTYGFRVDGLYDKYIAVENRDLKKIAKNLGAEDEIVEIIPDSIPDSFISKEEQKKLVEILTKYLNKLSEKIDVSSYKQEKYTIEDFDGKKFEGNKYTLEISTEKYMYDFCDIINEAIKDEELLSLLEGKVPENTMEQIKEFDIEEALDIKEEREDFDKNDYTEEDNNLKLSLYSYKGKTIKLDIYNENELVTEIYIVNKENSSHIQIKTHDPKTEYNEVASVDIIDLRNTFENNSGEMIIEKQTVYNEEDLKALDAENEEKENSDDDEYISYSSFSNYGTREWYEEREKARKSSTKITTNVENNVITSKVSIESVEETTPSITYTMKFGSDIKVPTLKSDNMVVVNDYTKEEFEKLGEEISEYAEKTAEDKPDTLIGTMFNAHQYNSSEDSWDDTDSDYDFSGNLTSDITTNDSEDEEISYEKDFVNSEIEYAINSLLIEYKNDLEDDSNTNLGDYLTGEKIQDEISFFIDNLEVVDGGTLKTTYHDKTFFTKIVIDGELMELQDAETLYSEDGTLENAE